MHSVFTKKKVFDKLNLFIATFTEKILTKIQNINLK